MVMFLQFVHPVAVFFRQILVFNCETQQCRYQSQRQQERAEQGETQGKGHGRKNLSFYTLESEDGQEGQNDDGLGEQNRMSQLDAGLLDKMNAPTKGLVLRQSICFGQCKPCLLYTSDAADD